MNIYDKYLLQDNFDIDSIMEIPIEYNLDDDVTRIGIPSTGGITALHLPSVVETAADIY